jgi:carbamoyltransferase
MPAFKSLGGMYSAVAHQIFYNMWEAGKVMGLAPFGRPEIPASEFVEIVDGHFRFFDKVPKRFEHGDRWPLRQREYQNLACSVQVAIEEALAYLVNRLRTLCPSEFLCYGGGVALNSIANERIIRDGKFKEVYIIPAAEDSGSAIGAAYYGLWQLTKKNTKRRLDHDSLGPQYSPSAILDSIEKASGIELIGSADVISDTVDLLCQGKILGWFQGRSELGPRSLGQRSIVCDPRHPDAKDILNSRVKHREAYRPFAPAVLLEEAENWFEFGGSNPESPFMLRICKFKNDKIDLVPAVAHIDGTGRLQTLTREANGRFYDLVKKFYEKTGVPILLNTSFNVAGEPIVETPENALACLLSSGLDGCVFEDKILMKVTATTRPQPTNEEERVGGNTVRISCPENMEDVSSRDY